MPLLEELDLGNAPSANDIENQMSSGGLPSEGFHHAQLAGCREGEAHSGTKFRELNFLIIAGPSKGFHVKESLFGPSGKSPEGDERARNRMRLFAHRLGLLQKQQIQGTDKFKYIPVPGVSEFSDLIDKANIIIEVKHEEREYEKDGKKRKITEAKLSFEGVIPLDDKRVKDVPRGKVAASPASGQLPKKDEFGDL